MMSPATAVTREEFCSNILYQTKKPDVTDIGETGAGFCAGITGICTRDIKI